MAIDIKQVNTAVNTQVNRATGAKIDHNSARDSQQSQSTLSPSPKSDSVSITSQAQQLQSTQVKMADIPEIDMEKVEQIKLAIAEGRYKIDPEQLATNIAIFENELKNLN